MAYSFDGTAKRITLSAGTVAVNLTEAHSRWKDWVLAGNAECLQAFRAVGGDIPAIPLYLFLLNGWRFVPQAADHTLAVQGGILEVEGGGDPFVDPAGSYKIRINREAPGIAIGYSSTGSTAPTAEQVAAAVGALTVEGAITLLQALRLANAANAGKTDGFVPGAAGFGAIRDMADSKDRVVAQYDENGNRVSIALDLT